jgi:hypothetical protein
MCRGQVNPHRQFAELPYSEREAGYGRDVSNGSTFQRPVCRLYHRKDGKVVKEPDDLLCASRYALMMLRYASTAKARREFYREIQYPKIGIV